MIVQPTRYKPSQTSCWVTDLEYAYVDNMPKTSAPHYRKISSPVTDPQYERLTTMASRREIPLTELEHRELATFAVLDALQKRNGPGHLDWVAPPENNPQDKDFPLSCLMNCRLFRESFRTYFIYGRVVLCANKYKLQAYTLACCPPISFCPAFVYLL